MRKLPLRWNAIARCGAPRVPQFPDNFLTPIVPQYGYSCENGNPDAPAFPDSHFRGKEGKIGE